MPQVIEAIVHADGTVSLKEPVRLDGAKRAVVTIFDDEVAEEPTGETALLSEAALARDWDRDEEDEAWSHLQPER